MAGVLNRQASLPLMLFPELPSTRVVGELSLGWLAGLSQSRRATGNRAAASWMRSPSRGMARYPHTGQRSHGIVAWRVVASSVLPRLGPVPDRHIRYPLGRVEVMVWRERDSRARPGFFSAEI